MSCQEYRDRVTVQLADGSETPGDHGDSCAECGRYAEQARAAWEALGRDPEQPVPEELHRFGRRPRRTDLFPIRPGSVAAAALLAAAALVLLWPATPGQEPWPMESDGMSVERYELPAGANAEAVAEEIRRTVVPESWSEGASGLELGDGYVRVRGPADVQKGVRELLQRRAR